MKHIISICITFVLAITWSQAAIVSHFSGSGVGAFAGTNAGTWGTEDVTNNSVAIEVVIDYVPSVASTSDPIILWDAGGSGTGSALVLNGSDLHYFASNSTSFVVTGAHGLTATTNGVQIVTVFELNSGTGTATDELMSLYVNGSLIGQGEFGTNNDWAGGENGSALGQESGTQRYNGTGLFNPGDVVSYPDSNITFDVYWLNSDGGPADNTLANILVAPAVIPEPSSVLLLMLGGVAFVSRRKR